MTLVRLPPPGWLPHSLDTFTHGAVLTSTQTITSTAWPTTNLAIYVPLRVPVAMVVVKLWYGSGSTGTGSNDIGLYDSNGARLVSNGNAAKPASATEDVRDVADTTIGPGLYYLALVASNSTDTYYAETDAAPMCAAIGVLTEALGSTVLPASASWAVNQTLAYYPRMGLLRDTTVT